MSAQLLKVNRFPTKMRIPVPRAFWHTNCQRYSEFLRPTDITSRKGVIFVRSAQVTIDEIRSVARRRWKLFAFCSLIVIVISIIGAYTLPRQYVSTTQILVQRDEILNPLVSYTMGVVLASEDRLRTFNEIIFSRKMSQVLIDTLGLLRNANSVAERDALLKTVQHNIEIDRRGSDSFTISYSDTDPVRAQRAAALIAEFFIKTNTDVENRRNDLSVQFFEQKLAEYREKYEASQKVFVSVLQQRVDSIPTQANSLYAQLDDINKRIADVDKRVQSYQEALVLLRSVSDSLNTPKGEQALFDLQHEDLPYAADLRGLVGKFEDLARRYTLKYPDVERLRDQIVQLLDRIRSSLESELPAQQEQRWQLEERRGRIIDGLKSSSVLQKADEDKESNYNMYRRLYDEMKVKLEQARTTLDLGRRGASQYIILDPAIVPTQPTKPNRILLIAGGFGVGILIGVLAVVAAELFDTTVRAPIDIERYHKPIIAFIPYAEWEDVKD
jgi:succinoglycan biosynthesis transport protein ExoP